MARLLIVDEYPPLATVMAIGLRRAGHDVVRVGSVQRAAAAEGPFALAVVDIELPDGDGVELAERLLASGVSEAIVFHTASRDAERLEAAARLGSVVPKEQRIERLLQVVENTLTAPAETALAAAVPDDVLPQRESGRSGTRRRVR